MSKTQITSEEYAKKGGTVCPFCGGSEIDTDGSIQADAGIAWQDLECEDCGETWQDQYVLTGYSIKK